MRRVLVTGATGFIGRQTLPFLHALGYEIHATYLRSPPQSDIPVLWHRADLLAGTNVCAEVRPSHLLHFAWYVNPADYKNSPKNDLWKEASLKLFASFKESGGVRAILAGSNGEYDWTLGHGEMKEYSSTLSTASAYSRAKTETRIAAENIAADSVSLAWTRTFHLYGPHEEQGRLVPKVIAALLKNESPMLDPTNPTLDFSYVADIAGAYVALLESGVQGVVNIGSGKPITVYELAKKIAERMDKSNLIGKEPAAGPVRVVANIARLKKEVGWRPKFALEAGLDKTIDWWKENA